MKKYVLSLDHGASTGFSVLKVENESVEICEYGLINLSKMTILERYETYKALFERIFLTYKIDYICTEKLNIAGSRFGLKSILPLTELKAIIKLLAESYRCEILESNPMSMKKYVTGTGRADKDIMAAAIIDMFKLPQAILKPYPSRKIKVYDIIDSIAVGYYAMCIKEDNKLICKEFDV